MTGFKLWSVMAGAALAGAAVLFGSVVASAEGDAVVNIESFETHVGGEAKIQLAALDVPEPGLGAWTIDVVYDEDQITLIECEAEHTAVCNETFADNTVRVSGINAFGLEGDRTLADLTFACKKAGSSELRLEVWVFADATPGDPQPMEAKLKDGKATCTEEPKEPTATPTAKPTQTPVEKPKQHGDVNCDDELDAVDAVLVLQYLAGLLDELKCEEHADFNKDTFVNAVDATLILQTVAGFI